MSLTKSLFLADFCTPKTSPKPRLRILKPNIIIWKVTRLGIQPYKRFHMSFRLHLLQLACHFLPTKIKKSLQNDMSRTLGNAWDMSIFPQENDPTNNNQGWTTPSKSQFLERNTLFETVSFFGFHSMLVFLV